MNRVRLESHLTWYEVWGPISVDHLVAFGMGVKKVRKSGYIGRKQKYYKDRYTRCYPALDTDERLLRSLTDLDPDQRKRISLLACGFNPVDYDAAEQLAETLDAHPGVFVGCGEVLTRHDALSDKSLGSCPRPNSEAMMAVHQLCDDRDLFENLHCNLGDGSEDFSYLPEVREVLESFPDLKLIWAHGGISYGITPDPIRHAHILGGMLAEFPNVSIDLSWSQCLEQLIDVETGIPHSCYLDLIETFPERFIWGTDVVGSTGLETYAETVSSWDVLFDALDPAAAALLQGGNMARILEIPATITSATGELLEKAS